MTKIKIVTNREISELHLTIRFILMYASCMDNPKPKNTIGNFAEVTDSVFINSRDYSHQIN